MVAPTLPSTVILDGGYVPPPIWATVLRCGRPVPGTAAAAWRLYVGAEELPLAWLQCRRRLGQSTWVVARVPMWSGDVESRLLAAIGGTMIVRTGASGSSSEFLRATMAEMASTPFEIRITGRVINPAYGRREWTLGAITARGRDADGRRTCACAAVHALIRPNDTVHDGDGQWVVGSVAYEIEPTVATMRLVEAG